VKFFGISMLAVLPVLAAQPDLPAILQEKNLEKRAELALKYSERLLDGIRDMYKSGDWSAVEHSLDQIVKGVALAYSSLQETGKQARRSPKHFKRAEKKTRELSRRLASFSAEVSFMERDPVEKARLRILTIHDELLMQIMGKKK